MKACNVKKADTFLVTRIPSWKLFSRLEHPCIKRAIMGKIPLKALKGFRRRLRNHLSRPGKRGITMYMSQPITESSIPNLARALQRLIPFQTVNSLPSRNWINARFSRKSKAPAKRLIQANTSQKITSLKNFLFPKHQDQTEVDGVVQSVITPVFSRWTSTYFSQHF